MQNSTEKPPIFGIDILPHTSPEATLAFSLVIIRGSQVLERNDRVSLSRLLRLARSMKPRFIAMDNVYELASSSDQLLRVISLLPSETQVVQVTGSPKHGLKQLHLLATEHGLSLTSKASPLQTAEVAARLTSLGVGYFIEAYKHRTIVSVSKGRVFGPGGMSQQRYRRRLCLAVLQVAHRIRERLRAEGLDYETTVRRSRWGYESCRFVVYADRARLFGSVKAIHGPDVRVTVQQVLANQIEFKPLKQVSTTSTLTRTRPTIVGVDPGIVTGIAVISLYGEVLSLYSGRGLDRGTIIESLTNTGHPVLVCSDVSPVPDTVRKIAAALDSRVFFPELPMSTLEKRDITQKFLEDHESGLRVEDTHQRDALAAVLKAYMGLKNKFEEADLRIRETGLRISRDLVRAELVRGAAISEALEMATPIPPPVIRGVEEPREADNLLNARIRSLEDRLRGQRDMIEKLVTARDELQEKLLSQSDRIRELELLLQRERLGSEAQLRRSREFDALHLRARSLETDLRNLEIENEVSKFKHGRLRELILRSIRNQLSFVKLVSSLTRQSVEQATAELSIGRGDTIFLAEAAAATLPGAQTLASKHIAAMIVSSELPQLVLDFLEGHGIPVISGEELPVEEFEGLHFTDGKRLEEMIRNSQVRIAEKERQASREMLDDVLEAYRRKRGQV